MATSARTDERSDLRLITPWVILFLALNLLLEQVTGNNGLSRFALLEAMVQKQTFAIDGFEKSTTDWAKTPDGHFYSNKAPGAAFVAYPLYAVFHRVFPGEKYKNLFLRLASFCFQVVPYGLLAYALITPTNALALSAYFFGTTLSMLLNSYFGHGLAAVFVLLLLLALKKQKPFWAGLAFGWAMLSDYGCALILFPTVAWVGSWRSSKAFVSFLAGGIFPGVLWMWYHKACFGGVLTLPNQFQNPEYVESAGQYAVWGILNLFPSPAVVAKLLFGTERGLLFTQPWILFVPFIAKKGERLFWFTMVSFILLFWMNCSFNGWHGGHAPGPRYLSPILPLFALLIPDGLSTQTRKLLWTLLAPSLVLYVLLMSTFIEAPAGKALWIFGYEAWRDSSKGTPYLRLGIVLVLGGVCFTRLRSLRNLPPYKERNARSSLSRSLRPGAREP